MSSLTAKTAGLKQRVHFSKPGLVTYAIVFGSVGAYLLFRSFALGPLASVEPENGTLASPAVVGTDAGASGGKFIQFGGTTSAPSGTSYFVDCTAGADTNNGTSQATAWKTLSKANAATLASGNNLLFKRGCTFSGSLTVKWSGVTVGSYGSGNLPVFASSTNNTNIINITGTGNTIDSLQASASPPSTDPNCANNPVGHIVDFNFPSGSSNNTVQNSVATGAYAGVFFHSGAQNNHILNNTFTNNNMMSPLDTTANNDAGAFGVLVWGNNNQVSNNTINGSHACSYDYGTDGSAIEIVSGGSPAASNNIFDHNKANNDSSFTETNGGVTTPVNNAYAYNQYISSGLNKSDFLTEQPATGLVIMYNNTAYITGTIKNGIWCGGTCDSTKLRFQNNIIATNNSTPIPSYTSTGAVESNNLGYVIGSSSNNPLFVNATGGDLHLQSGSPAIDKGTSASLSAGWNKDLDNHSVPAGSAVDIGAYEYGSVALRNHGSHLALGWLTHPIKKALAFVNHGLAAVGRVFGKFGKSFGNLFRAHHAYAITSANSTTPCVSAPVPTKWNHVVVLMFENHTYTQVVGAKNSSGALEAPYITSLVSKCGSYTNWHDADYKVNGIKDGTYVSKPNYSVLTNGQSPSVTGFLDDTYGTVKNVDNIYNEANTHGLVAKDYYDGPSSTTPCASSNFNGAYHDALRYYSDLGGQSSTSSTYCNTHDKTLTDFWNDVNGNSLPSYSMILPTNCENMHSCSTVTDVINNADTWVSNFLPKFFDSNVYKNGDTALFFLWDEDTPIPNILAAPSITANSKVPTPSGNPISHFSALRTTEEMLGLPLIGDTGQAPSLLSFFNGSGTTPPPDTTPPAVSITSPASGSTVSSNPVAVTASASDNVSVSKVEFYVNNTLKATDTSSPYNFNWDTTGLASGTYTLKATAYDAAGNSSSSSVNVTFQASSCTQAPTTLGTATTTISISSATTYHVWSRIMAPDTTNNSYYLVVDSGCPTVLGDSTSIPASTWTWVNYMNGNTSTPDNMTLGTGSHTVTMIGREAGVKLDRVLFLTDTCTPTGTGDNCTTTTDTTPPTVSMTTPAAGTVVSGTTTVSASATDNTGGSGIAKVDFYYGGTNLIGTATASPYQISWNTTQIPSGSYSLTAKATDVADNVATSSAVNVTVDNTPPTTSITSPANGSTVGNTASNNPVVVTVNSTDNVKVTKLELSIDGTIVSTATNPASVYSYSWDTLGYSNGTHTVQAKVYDSTNHTATSSVSVTVKNDTTAPTWPANALTTSAASSTSVSLNWVAASDDTGVIGYQIERNGVVLSTVGTLPSTTLKYTDSSLTAGTTYQYNIVALDNYGHAALSNTSSVTTPSASDSTPPTWPSSTALQLLGTKYNQVDLQWQPATDTGGSGLAGYKVYRNGTVLATVGTTVSSNGYISFSDATVSINTVYSYKVVAYDGANNSSADSNTVSTTTPAAPDTTPPTTTITSPATSSFLKGTVTVNATASDPTVAGQATSGLVKIELYLDGNLLTSSTTSPLSYIWNTTTASDGVHTLQTKAYDHASNIGNSTPVSITVDNTAPTIKVSNPASGAVVGKTDNITTSSSDNNAVTKTEIYIDSNLVASSASYSWLTPNVSDGSHTIYAKAYDAAGNVGASATVTVTVDNTAPTTPGGFTAKAVSATEVDLSWSASTDANGVTGYQLLRNGAVIQQLSATTLSAKDTTVAGSTTYSYSVQAQDKAGNVSNPATASITTPASADSTPPTAPSGLQGNAASLTQVNLSWTDSTDSGGSGLTGYNIYRDGTKIATVPASNTSYGDGTVSANTTYSYYVTAYDGAGNTSNASNTISVTTPASTDTTPPAVKVNSPVNGAVVSHTVTVSVTANDASGINRIGLYVDGSWVQETHSTANPYTFDWDSTTVGDGSHTLQVKATDNSPSANQSWSNQVNITVKNTITPTTDVFFPTDDAYVRSDQVNANTGSQARLQISNQYWGCSTTGSGCVSYTQHAYLKYTVSGLPTGSVVTAVKLRLYVIDPSGSGGLVYRVPSNSWSNSTITWKNAPAADTSTTLGTLGAVGNNQYVTFTLPPSLISGNGTISFMIANHDRNQAAYDSSNLGYNRPRLEVTFQ